MTTTGPHTAPDGTRHYMTWNAWWAMATCTTGGEHVGVGRGKLPDWYLIPHELGHVRQYAWLLGQAMPLFPVRLLGYLLFGLMHFTVANLPRLGGGLNWFERGPTARGLDLYRRGGKDAAIRAEDDPEVVQYKTYYAALLAAKLQAGA